MRLLPWVVPATSFLVAAVQAQSAAAIPTDLTTPSGVNVANVPDCAKVCLSNSTQYATDCAQIDVKCLCNSPSYVSALSCCLATNCGAADQQTAIQFNIQECSAVNSTAPDFVGCSPFSLTTGGAGSKTASSTATDNTAATIITEAFASVPAAYTNTKIGTASFSGSLLTGSCTVPLFAEITGTAQSVIQFPQVGCALNRGSCCPYDPNEYAGLTKCPDDYATTSGGCCPNGYSAYSAALGAETPCYSKPTKTYLPATSPTGTDVTVITDTVFSRRYTLVRPPKTQLPTGGIIGITINAVLLAVAPFIIIWLVRRHKRRKAEKHEREFPGATFPPIEPTLTHQMSEVPAKASSPTTPHELASPETGINTPITMKSMPYPSGLTQNTPSSPPAYEVPGSTPSDLAGAIPFEMPGSTYLHEHHPVFGGSSPDLSTPMSPPRTPPRSPAATRSTRSPVLSPSSPFRTDSPGTGSLVVTPLGSPGPLTSHGPGTRFREQM